MGEDSLRGDEPVNADGVERHGSGIVFALVALALVLAIGFFYLTDHRRDDDKVEAVTQTTASLDDAVDVVGSAAKNEADTLRRKD